MSNYDRWLEQPYNEQARQDEEFQELLDTLLETEYNIDNFDNFMEAIQDECLYKQREAIEDALYTKDTHQLGRIIYHSVLEWLEVMATREAERQL